MNQAEAPLTDGAITCYLVPGLGADSELFSRIHFPEWIDVRPLEWEPCVAGENLPAYAGRLREQVNPAEPHFYLGFSFGAAVAVELAKLTTPLSTVIVSGVARKQEIPFYLRRGRALGVYTLAPLIVRVWTPLLRWGAGFAFGTREPAAVDMLVRMIRSIDPSFYKCGLKAFMGWQNESVPATVLHIHGSRDRLLPPRYVQPEILIPDGGHFIIYTHGNEITTLIVQEVQEVLERLRPAVNSARTGREF